MNNAVLLISCSDAKGITASVTDFVFKNNGNIVHADQHIDARTNTFFMRIEWSLEGFALQRDQIAESMRPIADQFDMSWELHFTQRKERVAVFVSKHLHCLHDLLYRHKAGHFSCEIPLVISNHRDAEAMVKGHKIKFACIPKDLSNKSKQEEKELDVLKKEKIDVIVLARYHQIFSDDFVKHYPQRMINIHHSFLPSFAGKNPYAQAYEKGVKIIGATSHYVTKDLDQGPIIEQDIVRVSHRDNVQDLVRKGEDLEKIVLSRAVRWHLDKRILVYNRKTVVFD